MSVTEIEDLRVSLLLSLHLGSGQGRDGELGAPFLFLTTRHLQSWGKM